MYLSFCSPGAISLLLRDVFVVRSLHGAFFNVTTPNVDKNVVSSINGNKILKSVVDSGFDFFYIVFIGISHKE